MECRMRGHAIKVTISGGGPANAEFVCNAGDYADCHYYCGQRDCEEGCINPSGHRPGYVHSDYCGLTLCLSEGGTWDEQYEGPPADVRCGPIEVTWQDDYWTWRYADGEAA
jgi:hypothetical protein